VCIGRHRMFWPELRDWLSWIPWYCKYVSRSVLFKSPEYHQAKGNPLGRQMRFDPTS
jgi:hypothetical protein